MIDIHYTPRELAQAMIACVPENFSPRTIADFSAGEGSLLNEAAETWPKASIFANDLSPKSARLIASQNTSWHVSCSDFLKPSAHTHTKFSLKKLSMDLILLNPPFSERGRRPTEWLDYEGVKSGLAAAFISLSLKYLSDHGYMLAILPNGSLTSERDSQGWSVISEHYDVEIITDNHMRAFKSAVARTSIVKISRRKVARNTLRLITESDKETGYVDIKRGRIQMHSINPCADGFPLVHTTELKNGEICFTSIHGNVSSKVTIKGPAILFPRVGMVTQEKICILESDKIIALSDCVLAIETSDKSTARNIREQLIKNWDRFYELYSGTGAKYITVKRARIFFSNLNFITARDNRKEETKRLATG
jgi:methylase of polypeptide subunit release factors